MGLLSDIENALTGMQRLVVTPPSHVCKNSSGKSFSFFVFFVLSGVRKTTR